MSSGGHPWMGCLNIGCGGGIDRMSLWGWSLLHSPNKAHSQPPDSLIPQNSKNKQTEKGWGIKCVHILVFFLSEIQPFNRTYPKQTTFS